MKQAFAFVLGGDDEEEKEINECTSRARGNGTLCKILLLSLVTFEND
jgi:hypothetical protein